MAASQNKAPQPLEEQTVTLTLTSATVEEGRFGVGVTRLQLGERYGNLNAQLTLPDTFALVVGGVYEVTIRKVSK